MGWEWGAHCRAKRAERNDGGRRENDPIAREFVLEVADEGGGGDDDSHVPAAGAQGFFEFAKDEGGFAAAGGAPDEADHSEQAAERGE